MRVSLKQWKQLRSLWKKSVVWQSLELSNLLNMLFVHVEIATYDTEKIRKNQIEINAYQVSGPLYLPIHNISSIQSLLKYLSLYLHDSSVIKFDFMNHLFAKACFTSVIWSFGHAIFHMRQAVRQKADIFYIPHVDLH